MVLASRPRQLERLALLPCICTWVDRWRLNVRPILAKVLR